MQDNLTPGGLVFHVRLKNVGLPGLADSPDLGFGFP